MSGVTVISCRTGEDKMDIFMTGLSFGCGNIGLTGRPSSDIRAPLCARHLQDKVR